LTSSRVIGEADAKARIGYGEMWPRNLDTPSMRRTVRGVNRREPQYCGSPNVCLSQLHDSRSPINRVFGLNRMVYILLALNVS